MTDEALFYRRFVEDVRACAAGRAEARVTELERRVRVALGAPPAEREARWARVVAGVAELLAIVGNGSRAARRLRAFLRENADLNRPRDVALTDFRVAMRPAGVLRSPRGGYLLFAPPPRVRAGATTLTLDEVVPAPARRLAEWCVYGLCSGAAAAALWFAFIVPV